MSLADSDRRLIVEELGREPTREEAALFENLWSEHCAYRSSRPLLGRFDSEGDAVVVGPGDDAAAVALPDDETYITIGVESHNHPSYVDPYDGAATGVGGIVRDTLSMGAYPIALADSLYFGDFDRQRSRYLLEGVVEGIADYGNAIGVPTVAGSLAFHPDYEGNPLVNVACVGLTDEERLLRGALTEPGNVLVLVGNATGRDGLGGASFASEDLSEDAETEDRPAVQVGDPYEEKLLIEVNEQLIEADLVESARDLGAAGLGGATSEMAAQGDLGAHVELDRVHQREPGMNALEILLSESQERMCYEVRPEHVDRVQEVASRFDVESSVIGEVTEDRYVCSYDGETVVDVPAPTLAEGAPVEPRDRAPAPTPPVDRPVDVGIEEAFDAVVGSPNAADTGWVYHQYDHEVGVRTAVPPGHDAAVLAIREADVGLALSAGADPWWTDQAPYEGARAVAIENATNLAAVGARPLAAVDCLNGGNPETSEVFDGFARVVEGLADACRSLAVPVVGGNVSLYNDSASGPIPPTPTVAMVGTTPTYEAPSRTLTSEGELLLVGDRGLVDGPQLGGSEYLAQFGGTDRFPSPPGDPQPFIETTAAVATRESTNAVHDVAQGGLAVALAEMISEEVGAAVEIATDDPIGALCHEQAGRVLIQTTDPEGVRDAFAGVAPVETIGSPTATGELSLTLGEATLNRTAGAIDADRAVLERTLE